ncbi:MAG: pilus assembly protein [Thermaerobacter sp.]|nr:pilus assembly protein [Thermaerobacter sp.]
MGNQGRRGERGQSLVLYALLILVLFAFVAFAVDIGRAYALGNNLTETSDAAALAGAQYLNNTPTCNEITEAVNTAVNTLTDNGYPSRGNSWTSQSCTGTVTLPLTVTVPLTSGQTATLYFHDPSGNNYLQVTLPAVLNYTFARVLGFTSLTVTRSGTAVNEGASPPGSIVGTPTTSGCPNQGVAPQGLDITTYDAIYAAWQSNPQQPVYFALEPTPSEQTPQLMWGTNVNGMMGSGATTGSGTWYRLDLNGEGTKGWDTNLENGYSGTVSTGQPIYAQTGYGGHNGAKACQARLNDAQPSDACAQSNSQYLTLPIVEMNSGSGAGTNYTVRGFCYAKIICAGTQSINSSSYNCSNNNVVLQYEGYIRAPDGAAQPGSGTPPPPGSIRRVVNLVNP